LRSRGTRAGDEIRFKCSDFFDREFSVNTNKCVLVVCLISVMFYMPCICLVALKKVVAHCAYVLIRVSLSRWARHTCVI